MAPPSIAQQRGLAYAPKPFAIISFVASGYVVYHLLYRQPQKRKRLYHRLVLAMNLAILPLSLTYFWSTWAVPEGTPYYAGAAGNVQTCTAQGFISLMLSQTVPFYYGSLSLQSFMAIRNNFKEENYVWIEKWVHVIAICVPCALAILVAATENFNPSGSGCWLSKAPRGCESDPEVPCERGEDISLVVYTMGFGQIVLYFVLPPSGVLAIFLWLRKVQKRAASSSGLQRIREAARKKIMQSVAVQISVYLFSFWGTFVFSLVHMVYQVLTGNIHYNLLILANVVFSLQGFVIAIVYFTLERIGRRSPKVDCFARKNASTVRTTTNSQLTVSDIRQNARERSEICTNSEQEEPRYTFHIFDGTVDPSSPWARYIDPSDDECDSAEEVPDEEECLPRDDFELEET